MRTHNSGFTLIELLIAIGIIGILSSIVIVAINPTEMFNKTKDAVRLHDLKQIENSILQALIDSKTVPALPGTIGTAKDICVQSVTGTACTESAQGVDLAFLAPDYIASIPVDPDQHGGIITGYRIYKEGSFFKACSPVLDPTCGGPYVQETGSSSSEYYTPDPLPSSAPSFSSSSASSFASASSSASSGSASSSLSIPDPQLSSTSAASSLSLPNASLSSAALSSLSLPNASLSSAALSSLSLPDTSLSSTPSFSLPFLNP